MKKYLRKKLAGRVEDFSEINLTDVRGTIPETYLANYETIPDALAAFAKDAIKEYIYEHDDKSDEIAKNVFGKNYSEKFKGSVDKFISELASKILSDGAQDLPLGIQNIIDKYTRALKVIDNVQEEAVQHELDRLINEGKALGFDSQKNEGDVLVLEREYKNGTLSIAIDYEDPHDLYFEGGFESPDRGYRYISCSSLDSMLEAFEHPEDLDIF